MAPTVVAKPQVAHEARASDIPVRPQEVHREGISVRLKTIAMKQPIGDVDGDEFEHGDVIAHGVAQAVPDSERDHDL